MFIFQIRLSCRKLLSIGLKNFKGLPHSTFSVVRVKTINSTHMHSVPAVGQKLSLGLRVWGGDPRPEYDALKRHLKMPTMVGSVPEHGL